MLLRLCFVLCIAFGIHSIEAALSGSDAIDTAVFDQCKRLGIEPAPVCSDEVFLRRAQLDVIGTLPTAAEAQAFLANRNPDKRRALIDRLLEREEFADYCTMKWSDALRVKAEFPINLWPNAAQAYHAWIRASVRENKPYDQFARELLTSSGSNFRVGPVNFYRAVQSRDSRGLAQAVALTFLGSRANQWPRERLAGFSHFFEEVGFKTTGEWKEEIVLWDRASAANARVTALLPDGTSVVLTGGRDPREVFADWLINRENPWFARCLVNRVWSWLLGRGIVHEADDFRPDNPPSNPELLDALSAEFVASGYDVKQLFRVILNSKTYQLSSIPKSNGPEAAAHFACYAMRRLEAEVLIDALNQVTTTKESYSSAIPEPFTFVPDDIRAIALPDGSITSPFLELFGRSPRDTGLESERNNSVTAAQRLHLLNSSHIQRKIEQSRMVQFQLQGNRSIREITGALYLGILSRRPSESELNAVEAYAKAAGSRREAVIDLAWALINSVEFLYRH
jgi:hypothetical protein